MKNLAFFIFVIVIMASCLGLDKGTFVAYNVENKSGVSVKLTLVNMPVQSQFLRKDSTILLGNNEVWYYGGDIGSTDGSTSRA